MFGAQHHQRSRWVFSSFDRNPVATTAASIGPCSAAVPVDGIWSDKTDTHRKWQVFHKTVFVWTCEDVFKTRLAPKKENRFESFKVWQGMPKHPKILALNLGGIEDIPVRMMGIADAGRRAKVTENAVRDGDGYDLEDIRDSGEGELFATPEAS